MLTWVEVKKSAIEHNIKAFRRRVGKNILLMPVIKANAYGHGLLEVADICDKHHDVDRICVVNLEEALLLRANKIKKPIMVLGIYELDEKVVATAIQSRIIIPLYTREQAMLLERVAKRVGKRAVVHVKIDTGTSRIGVLPNEAVSFIREIKKLNHLKIEGLWSHFSSSENDKAVTKAQLQRLSDVVVQLHEQHVDIPIIHMACSASTMLYPSNFCNAVRFGVSTYGLHPDISTYNILPLKPALSWKTTIIQVKTIPKGSKISYGGTYVVKRETRLAVLPVGYYDGYVRALSNKGVVLVNGKRCPVRGRVCMNVMMIDVTDVPGNVSTGTAATLIGRDRSETVSADELALLSGTINYEVVTRINPLIPRVVV